MSHQDFACVIYTDADQDYIYIPEMLIASNSYLECHLDDLQVDDGVLLYSADGRDYRGLHVATVEDVKQFRKLVAAQTATRIYNGLQTLLADLDDNDLECLLISRGLNS